MDLLYVPTVLTNRPSQKGEINRVVDDNAADDRSSAFILESTDEPYIGARAILELGNQIDNFATRRIPNADAMESVTQLFPGVESAPAVVFTEGSVTRTYYVTVQERLKMCTNCMSEPREQGWRLLGRLVGEHRSRIGRSTK